MSSLERTELFLAKRTWIALSIILLFALSIRLLFVKELSASIFAKPFSLDEIYYLNWARAISSGQFIGKTVFYGLPLYPYFLGLVYWLFSASLTVARSAQAFLGLISCLLVYFVGKKAFSRTIGLLSSLIFSLYGLFIFYEGQVLSVTLAILLYLITLLLLFTSFEKENSPLFLLSGIALGLSGITMSGIFLFAPFVIFCIWRFFGKKISWVFLSTCFLLGVLLPVSLTTLHNYKAEKDFVPVTAHGGITFYTGNNPDAKPYFQPVKGIDAFDIRSFAKGAENVAEKDLGRELKPSEVSSYWHGKALGFIIKNPVRYVKLVLEKLLFFLNSREIYDVAVNYDTLKEQVPVLKACFLSLFLVGPFALLGIILSMGVSKEKLLLYFFLLSYTISNIIFMINSRYRLPMVPVLIVFASYSIVRLISCISHDKKSLAKSCGILAAAFILTNLPLDMPTPGKLKKLEKIGISFIKSDQYDKALDTFVQIIQKDPSYIYAYDNLAKVYLYKGMPAEAEKTAKKAIEINPNYPEIHNTLGVIFVEQNKLKASLREFKTASEMMPNNAEYIYTLGFAYLRLGEAEQGITKINKAIAISPKPHYYNTLGLAYKNTGDTQKAVNAWKNALKLDKNFNPALENLKKYAPKQL